jgi:hypothetical protein
MSDSTDAYENSDSFSGNGSLEVDFQERRPSKLFPIIGILSVTLGLILGIYGFITQDGSTSRQQYLLGALGYLLSALVPIVLLQLSWTKHISSVSNNVHSPYDIHAGEQQQSLCRKITLIGLLVAALPIYIFFLPVAEYLA